MSDVKGTVNIGTVARTAIAGTQNTTVAVIERAEIKTGVMK
jgi:hypothetical protein